MSPRNARRLFIGVAGWSLPRALAASFPGAGSHLNRYGAAFNAVEINSTFKRSHRAGTYARWAESVPAGFKFAVKTPQAITHEMRLVKARAALETFVGEIAPLGDKLGPVLVQLPPTLMYDRTIVTAFFKTFRGMFKGPIACEPRHRTWFTPAANDLLAHFGVARVAADPAVMADAAAPGGAEDFAYWRLHGSPKMYYSSYARDELQALARKLRRRDAPREQWCIFDNTALGAGTANALQLLTIISGAI